MEENLYKEKKMQHFYYCFLDFVSKAGKMNPDRFPEKSG
jgi:hypothetical protein